MHLGSEDAHARRARHGFARTLERWLDLACGALRSRWEGETAAGQPIVVGSKLRLEGSVLIRKGSRIDLRVPFDLREIAATQHSSGLMSLRAGTQMLLLDHDDENHLVLRRLVNECAERNAGLSSSLSAEGFLC